MARGATLSSIMQGIRNELWMSSDLSVGQNFNPALMHAAIRAQSDLYTSFDWEFLRMRSSTVALVVGQTGYTLGGFSGLGTLNPDRGICVYLRQTGQKWCPLERGITIEDFTVYDSLASPIQTAFPPRKWDLTVVAAAADAVKIEIWPAPNSTAAVLVAEGYSGLAAFSSENDLSTLDSRLIELQAAGTILESRKSGTGLPKFRQLAGILRHMRANIASDEPVRLGEKPLDLRLYGVHGLRAPGT